MVDEEEIIRVAELMKIDLEDHGEHVSRVKKMLEYFDILDQIDLSSEEIMSQQKSLNEGHYLEGVQEARTTNFKIGVAGYPETHREAINRQTDLENLKHKVDAGATFIITQMFFDNQVFFEFEKDCREIGINVPIIPGLKVITSKKQIEVLPELFHTIIPDHLKHAIEKCTSRDEVIDLGIQHTLKQSRELIDSGVPCLHFFTMNDLNFLPYFDVRLISNLKN
mgnify:CR=1 FL=1